ncbi:MAG: adenylosuccinate synthetase [Candidatus Nitrosotenuis sp.]
MSKEVIAIIGANFGDEGKGLFTDYFANVRHDGIVVRHSGGAQVGHTVVLEDGKRHVFSHFGSGSFVGLPTFLGKEFVIHPSVFKRELIELWKKQVDPKVVADPRSIITTHIDVILNQSLERKRVERHGSVGLGFCETIERNTHEEFGLTLIDLFSVKQNELQNFILSKMKHFRNAWLNVRLEQLELTEADLPEYFFTDTHEMDKVFADMCMWVRQNIRMAPPETLDLYGTVIFEGSQGLALDQNSSNFPHVTRANTGVKNAIEMLDESGIDISQFTAMYVSRTYMTKHGAGPLPHEDDAFKWPTEDETNISHEFQGEFRTAPINMSEMGDRIMTDFKQIPQKYNPIRKLGMTHFDKIGDTAVFYINSTDRIEVTGKEYTEMMMEAADLMSSGPTRYDITVC